MSILYTGEKGTPLREIIKQLGNKSYATIACRYLWDYEGNKRDDLFGYCSYDNKTRSLEPLDGDVYSLDDLYILWEEDPLDGHLTVWQKGELANG